MIGPILHGILRLFSCSSRCLHLWRNRHSQRHGVWKQRLRSLILSWRPSLIQTWRKSSKRSMFWDRPISQPQRERGWVDIHHWSCGGTHQDCVLIALFVFPVQYHSEPDGQHLLNCKGVSHSRGMLVFGAWWETLPTLCWCLSVRVKVKVKIHVYSKGYTSASKDLCFR